MKYTNPFFKKRKKNYLSEILKILNIKNNNKYKNILINDIKNLDQALNKDVTFFHSIKYKLLLNSTKSKFIITNSKLSNFIPAARQKRKYPL